LRRRISAIAKADPAILVEDKGYAMAVHFRQAPQQEGAIKRELEAIRRDFPPGSIEVLPGKSVVEVKVAGFDKGTALRELMTHPNFAGRRPIFVGDDTTDETGFAAMPEFGGVPISVGREVPGVTKGFANPSDVRRWLQRLAAGGGLDGL